MAQRQLSETHPVVRIQVTLPENEREAWREHCDVHDFKMATRLRELMNRDMEAAKSGDLR